jgi:hypothetical protein
VLSSGLAMKNPDFFKPLKINSYALNDSGESVLILENIPMNKIDEFFSTLKMQPSAEQ